MKKISNRGFTLIELVIFIIVGAIFIPLTYVAFTTAMKSAATPDNMVKARFYAEQKMEELTSYSYTNPNLNPGGPWNDNPETGYTRTWTITLINSDLAASEIDVGYKKIVVSVTPPGGSTFDVSTIITRRPKS